MALGQFYGQLVLISLETPDAFVFNLFPNKVQSTDKANWEPQDVSIGTKPLFYGNRDPRRIAVPECWLDGTEKGESITPQINALRKLLDETKNGTPPALLLIYGDRQERCVLSDLSIEEQFFDRDGSPLRATVNLTLLQLQEESESVSVVVREADGSGIGNF
jgi:contractile injection system tube protein